MEVITHTHTQTSYKKHFVCFASFALLDKLTSISQRKKKKINKYRISARLDKCVMYNGFTRSFKGLRKFVADSCLLDSFPEFIEYQQLSYSSRINMSNCKVRELLCGCTHVAQRE